jgi:hypothetical protein
VFARRVVLSLIHPAAAVALNHWYIAS